MKETRLIKKEYEDIKTDNLLNEKQCKNLAKDYQVIKNNFENCKKRKKKF